MSLKPFSGGHYFYDLGKGNADIYEPSSGPEHKGHQAPAIRKCKAPPICKGVANLNSCLVLALPLPLDLEGPGDWCPALCFLSLSSSSLSYLILLARANLLSRWPAFDGDPWAPPCPPPVHQLHQVHRHLLGCPPLANQAAAGCLTCSFRNSSSNDKALKHVVHGFSRLQSAGTGLPESSSITILRRIFSNLSALPLSSAKAIRCQLGQALHRLLIELQ